MASMIPYDRYARGLRAWPFDAIDNFFDAPLASLATDAGFKMNVEDAGDREGRPYGRVVTPGAASGVDLT